MRKRRITKKVVGAFFLTLALCMALSAYIEYGRRQREDDQMKFIAGSVSAQTYEVLSAQLNKAKTLEAFVVQNEGGTGGFERVARLLVTDSTVRNVLLAPGGVVSDVYPLKGNESVLGHDLTGAKAGDKEAQAAIDRGDMIMAGPFSLVQGGLGIAGRLPVYLNGSFWGIRMRPGTPAFSLSKALNGAVDLLVRLLSIRATVASKIIQLSTAALWNLCKVDLASQRYMLNSGIARHLIEIPACTLFPPLVRANTTMLLAVLAVIGDLAESIVKRALDAKDSGQMLPGIGGSLDLIDSICFTAPALFFYLTWFLLPHA